MARLLWKDRREGSRSEAIAFANRALRLDPYDRAGTRYLLMSWEAAFGNWAAARRVALRHRDEWRAETRYWLALHAFRDGDPRADPLLERAVAANPYVPLHMLCRAATPIPTSSDPVGSAEEAALLADDARPAWAQSPGALQWLASRI